MLLAFLGSGRTVASILDLAYRVAKALVDFFVCVTKVVEGLDGNTLIARKIRFFWSFSEGKTR